MQGQSLIIVRAIHVLLFTFHEHRRFTTMQNPTSPVSSGNISPIIVGPSKDTKEVYLIAGLIVSLSLVVGPLWYYSEQDHSFSLKTQSEPMANAQVTQVRQAST